MKKNVFFYLLSTLLLLSACKGEMGPAGADGQDGQDGNANVNSQIISVATADWITDNSENWVWCSKSCPVITSDIASNGLVVVYAKGVSGISSDEWVALPYVYVVADDIYDEVWSYSFKAGSIEFRIQEDDGIYIRPDVTFKVVVASADGRAQRPDLDWYNYREVAEAMGWSD